MKFVTIDQATFKKFADKHPSKSFYQTPEIAKLREAKGWTTYYFAVTDDNDKILASAFISAKPTFLGKSLYYCPGGPLLDYEDRELTTFFFKNLKKYAKSHNGYLLHIEPNYELIERDRDGAPLSNGFNHQQAVTTLKTLGFTRLPHADSPEYQFALNLNGLTPDELMQTFKRNTRGHIRKAEKSGVKVRELKREELKVFKQITESTSARRDFEDKPLSYYEQMYDLFHDKGEVMFMLAEVEEQSESASSQHLRNSDSHFHNGHGRVAGTEIPGRARLSRCENDDRELSTLRTSASDCYTPLSAAMFMLYGDEVIYLFSGSDEKYMKEYNAQYLIQWHMIKYASDHKFKRYNFYGISGIPKNGDLDGIYEFKKGFTNSDTGRVVELLGAYELPINSTFYHLHHFLSKLKHH